MSKQGGIDVAHLVKEYRVHHREAGARAAIRSVFRRKFDIVRAVDDLSFSIDPGETIGFLGPNGAGKTTTLKILAGLLYPTAGDVRVAGHVPQRREEAFLKRITLVMGQKQQLIWDLPPVETFALNRAIYEVTEARFRETLAELDHLLGISEISRKPTRQLSLGERMKCELVAALLHRPDVLFLDEPTIGLDVSMQLSVREFIRTYGKRTGATTILTSHYMDDVIALCPRVIVIDKGKLRYDGSLDGLVHSIRPDKRIVLRSTAALDPEMLARIGGILEQAAAKTVLSVPQAKLRDAVSQLLSSPSVTDLTVEDPPLEEVLRDLFSRRDEAPR